MTSEKPAPSVALSHTSLELGHLYMEDLADENYLVDYFANVEPWFKAITGNAGSGRNAQRISTCFLIDDYFSQLGGPEEIIKKVLRAAELNNLTIDYIARESSCAEMEGVSLARKVFEQIVPEPHPGTTGARPTVKESGWLSNGKRSPNVSAAPALAMSAWEPPIQTAAARHSVFVDVEIRDRDKWSCAFLAAVWQLLRLGLIRPKNAGLMQPVSISTYPDTWAEMPPVIQMTPRPRPFCAYRTVSILPAGFMEVELAARTVLQRVRIDDYAGRDLITRADNEGITLSADILNRIDYAFINEWDAPSTGD
ncbi:SCO2522 family protein [Actinoplanes sp. NPDC020271]|uniref:SCO2522 family protein n=1 Tax=Actinoplanes sp. NPDC020271 TaxID=3363896 RepID=UPI0037AA0BD8